MVEPHSDGEIQVDHLRALRRSLRVACVTETYPPEVNGVATTIARVVEGLHQRNHDVQLIRPRQRGGEVAGDSARFHEVLMRGLPVPNYPHLRMGPPAGRALLRLWSQQRPDVVHIATEGPLGWSALQAATRLRVPVSSDFRTNFHAYSRHYQVGWLARPIVAYLRKFHNRTQCTMVPTEALRRELEAGGFKRLAVVARGVDTRRFDPSHRSAALRAAWGAGADDVVLCYVGRIAAEKNLDALAAAYLAARQHDPRVRLVVVGEGPLRDALQARCPDAVFAGQRRGDDLSAHYASADVFVFPSVTETFGNVTVEAMASALPVVAFDHAAAAQFVRPGEHGLLAPVGDTAAFVAHTRRVAGERALRAHMGERARARAADLDWDQVIGQFEAVLSRVILQARMQAVPGRLGARAAA